jgi:hypothetical protein
MGYMVYFQAISVAIRCEAFSAKKRPHNEKDIIYISVPLNSGSREVSTGKMKEFRIDDAMYDIIDEKVKDGKIIYTCLRDHNEEHLFTKARNFNDESSPFKAKQKPVRSITENIIKTALVSNSTSIAGLSNSRIFTGDYYCMILMPFLAVEVPPPQTVS